MLLVFLIGALVAQLSTPEVPVSLPVDTVTFASLPSQLQPYVYVLHNDHLLKDCLLTDRHPTVLPPLPLELNEAPPVFFHPDKLHTKPPLERKLATDRIPQTDGRLAEIGGGDHRDRLTEIGGGDLDWMDPPKLRRAYSQPVPVETIRDPPPFRRVITDSGLQPEVESPTFVKPPLLRQGAMLHLGHDHLLDDNMLYR